MSETPPARDRYHHGHLRAALLEAAVAAIGEEGLAALSLRDVARRAAVSHAAPAHHFGDKAGLVTALATEGFELLAAELERAMAETGQFLEVGVAYVRFAVTHQAHFAVMFRPDLHVVDDPALVAAQAAAGRSLHGGVGELAPPSGDFDASSGAIAAWSLVHGVATLWLAGVLPERLGDDVEAIARAVAGHLRPT